MISLLFSLFFAYSLANSVTAQVRNEFSDAIVLQTATLSAGTWEVPPPKNIAAGTTYNTVWKASGDGVEGRVVYTSPDGRAVVKFTFANVGGNQTAAVSVAPPPWIGGLGQKTGDKSDVTFQYWLHKMCLTTEKCN